uniref:Uncharacterized protein n=1 Tax=Pipistrellus kuhlii TaxID=59472 RepID=A0A7J7VV04_PIPKU|nr:hypothetical protein mPipKuh1_008301 [Pipistrellus kuhlii]
MGAGWFALKGVLDQGGGSLGAWGSLSKGPVVVCRPATYPGDSSIGRKQGSGIYSSSIIETLLPPSLGTTSACSSSVVTAIFVGLICILTPDWLVGMACEYNRDVVNLHIFLLDRISLYLI